MKKFLFHNFQSLVIFNLGNAFSFFFSIILARNLSLDNFGSYSIFMSFLGYMSIPATFFSIYISKELKNLNIVNLSKNLGNIFKISFYLLSIIIIVFFILNKFKLINIDYLKIILLFFLVFTIYGNTLINSSYLVLEQYKKYGFFSNLPFFFKLIFVIFYINTTELDFNSVILFILLSYLFTFLINFRYLKKNIKIIHLINHNTIDLSAYFNKKSFFIIVLIFFSQLISNVDLFMFKHFYNGSFLGDYSVINLLARIPFIAVAPLISIFIPELAKNSISFMENLKKFMILVLLNSIIYWTYFFLFKFFAREIILFTYGSSYLTMIHISYDLILFFWINNIIYLILIFANNFKFISLKILSLLYLPFIYFYLYLFNGLMNEFTQKLFNISLIFLFIITLFLIYNIFNKQYKFNNEKN